MPEQQNLNLPIGKAFVRKSATIAPVLQYSKQTSLRATLSLAKWCTTSMCLVLLEAIGCFSSLIAPWLSQLILIAPVLTPSPLSSFLSHNASLTACAAAMYSASEVDAATVGCSLLLQLIAPPYMVNTHPVVDLLVSMSAA